VKCDPKMEQLPPAAATFARALAARTARVAVIGLGYAGLPLAEVFLKAGFPVLGLDLDSSKIAHLRRGETYLGHVSAERVRAMVATNRFEPTTDPARLADADATVICVPTPLTPAREPDLSAVTSAAVSSRPRCVAAS
jgi:UDP-N-acetyl-D-glucosamine dehydrogenase